MSRQDANQFAVELRKDPRLLFDLVKITNRGPIREDRPDKPVEREEKKGKTEATGEAWRQIEALFERKGIEKDELSDDDRNEFERWAVKFLNEGGEVEAMVGRFKEANERLRITRRMYGWLWEAVDKVASGDDLTGQERNNLRLSLVLYRLFPDAFRKEWAVINDMEVSRSKLKSLFMEVLKVE